MDQPKYILTPGTKVVTDALIHPQSFQIQAQYLTVRRPNAHGVITGVVGGHGGDVYWVKHQDDAVAAYGFWEFQLCRGCQRESGVDEDEEISTMWDHLEKDCL